MPSNGLIGKRPISRLVILFTAAILAVSWLTPVFLGGHAEAAGQLTSRSLAISTAVPSATGVSYVFTFTVAATTQVQGLKFTACTTAIGSYPGGTCTAPTGMTGAGNGFTATTYTSQSGWQGATNFAVDLTGGNDCTAAANVLCAKRTDATAQTVTSRTITFGGTKNPSTVNTAFYVGITTYSTNNWTLASVVDAGTTASAIVQSLTVNAAVAEILNFCVGSTLVNDATTSPATDCTAVTGTSINIGTLDSSTVNISPVTINGGDSKNGVAMLRTNAQNGATVSYRAIQAGTGTNHLGTLRLSGATCSASTGPGTGSPPAASGPFTDGCIDAAGSTQNAFTAGSEEFGMTIAGVNCGSTTSYTCVYSSSSNNLVQQTGFIGGSSASAYGASAAKGFVWDESGASAVIASSASSTIKQVDDESLILVFAATPSITTPFGSYTVQADYIAVPTY